MESQINPEKLFERYRILMEEAACVKHLYGAVIISQVAVRHYPGSKSVDEEFEKVKSVALRRIAEIEGELKDLVNEVRSSIELAKQAPQGGVQ